MKRLITRLALTLAATGMVVGFGASAFAGEGHGKHHERGKRGGPVKLMKKLEKMDEEQRLEFLENRLDRRVERMTEHLDLTEDQVPKVRQILADAQTQTLDVWERNRDDGEAARKEFRDVHKRTKAQLNEVLTDGQIAEAKKLRRKRHRKFKGRMLHRLDEKLDLTDDQEAQVKEILDDAHAQMRELRENDEDPGRGQFKAIMKDASSKIEAVLTPEQAAEYAELKEKRKEHRRRFKKRRGKNF